MYHFLLMTFQWGSQFTKMSVGPPKKQPFYKWLHCQPTFQALFTNTTATPWNNKASGPPTELRSHGLWTGKHPCWCSMPSRHCHSPSQRHNPMYALSTQGSLHSWKLRADPNTCTVNGNDSLPSHATQLLLSALKMGLFHSLCFPNTCLAHAGIQILVESCSFYDILFNLYLIITLGLWLYNTYTRSCTSLT